jgi:RecA-family ATPase
VKRTDHDYYSLFVRYIRGLTEHGQELRGLCPFHDDHNPSFTANRENGLWKCFGCEAAGNATHFAERVGETSASNGKQQHRKIVATYPYQDEAGALLYEVVRYSPKAFSQRRPDGNGGWIYNLAGTRRVLYRLPELLRAETIYVVEGERDADRLRSLGLTATTCPGGAGKWRSEYSETLRGKHVIVLPDNDQVGEEHAQAVARSLLAVAASVKIVRLPGLPAKGDVSDWLDAGHSADELLSLVKATPELRAEKKAQSDHPVLTRLSDVKPEKVRWLWPGRIPLGKVTVLDGDPGLGKSLISIDLTARVTTAREMPGGTASDLTARAGVVLLSAEDDLADTIRPRLDAAGADCSRIVALTGVREAQGQRLPDLADLEAIQQAIHAVNAKLVIVDPLMAYLPSQTDSHRDQDVRRNLAPLAALAAETGVAVLVIRHLNKGGGKNPLYRGGGSIGIIGAARSGLLVAADPEDETGERRVLVPTKSNLARAAVALAYHVSVTRENVAYVTWEGQSKHTAASLLAQPEVEEDRPALEEAKSFLCEVLANGAVPAKDVQKQADQAGISYATLRRAKTALKILALKKEGFFSKKEKSQQWCWCLPSAEDAQPREHEHLQQSSEKNSSFFNGFTEDAQISEFEHLQAAHEHLQAADTNRRNDEMTRWGWFSEISDELKERWLVEKNKESEEDEEVL